MIQRDLTGTRGEKSACGYLTLLIHFCKLRKLIPPPPITTCRFYGGWGERIKPVCQVKPVVV